MITRSLLISAPLLGFAHADGSLRPVIQFLLIAFLLFGCAWLFLEIRQQLAAQFASIPTPAPALPPVAGCSEEIPASRVAVIAAAVHHCYGPRTQLVAIAPVAAIPGHPAPIWSTEGRRSIYSSHQVR